MSIATGDIVNARYRLLEKLGDGGMGDVFLAEDLHLSRRVAIKTIRSELRENQEIRRRIDRECSLHAKLGVHPNIVALHDRLDEEKNIFLIMEYVCGETVATLLAKKRTAGLTFLVEEAVSIIQQTLKALAYIHDNDIIHRDIKPANILLSKTEQGGYIAKLMDFGIAYLESDDEAMTRLTTLATGGPGTPAYMAPERIDPETFGAQGSVTDLYSVGVIFYELLGGSPPFHGKMTEVFTGHLTKVPDFSSLGKTVPVALIRILEKSLKKQQEERYQDARSFLKDLDVVSVPDTDKTVLVTSGYTLDKTLLATGRDRENLVAAISTAKAASRSERGKKRIYLLGVALIAMFGTATIAFWLVERGTFQASETPGEVVEERTVEAMDGESTGGVVPDPGRTASSKTPDGNPLREEVKSAQALPADSQRALSPTPPAQLFPEPAGLYTLEPVLSSSAEETPPPSYFDRSLYSTRDANAIDALNKAREEKHRSIKSNKPGEVRPKATKRVSPKRAKSTEKPKGSPRKKDPSSGSSGGWKVLKNETRKIN